VRRRAADFLGEQPFEHARHRANVRLTRAVLGKGDARVRRPTLVQQQSLHHRREIGKLTWQALEQPRVVAG
jgi:hypothetical protein